jgi:fibronectin-binding autotransporter adhesin
MAFTAASTRSGGTTINAGTVEIAAANALGTGASAGITMGGGTLLINYASSGSQNSMAYAFGGGTLQLSGNTTAVTQGIGAVTIGNGSATINAAPGAGGTTTVNMGAISRTGTATRAFLNLTGTATYTTTQANDASGKIAGLLLNGGFAKNNGSNTIVAYTGTDIVGTTISAGSTTDYVIGASVTGDLSMAASGVTTIGSLTLDSATGRTVNIGAGNTLRLAGPILQKTSGVAFNFGTTGTLTAGSADNTAADLYISATGGVFTGTGMTLSGLIADNGTGALTLIKGGIGGLTLSATNTYTGGTIIQQGRLSISADGNVGSGAITVNDGGQLYITGGTISRALTLNGGSGIDDGGGRGNLGALRLEV